MELLSQHVTQTESQNPLRATWERTALATKQLKGDTLAADVVIDRSFQSWASAEDIHEAIISISFSAGCGVSWPLPHQPFQGGLRECSVPCPMVSEESRKLRMTSTVHCKAVRVDSAKAVCSWHVLSVGLARALGRATYMHCCSLGGGRLCSSGMGFLFRGLNAPGRSVDICT